MKTLERLGQVRSDLSSIFISILSMNQPWAYSIAYGGGVLKYGFHLFKCVKGKKR